jgi:cyanophycinase
VVGIRPITREQANAPEGYEPLKEATGVFITGGNQLRLVTVVGATKLEDALVSAHDRGAVVGGTSAGASAVAAHMVAFGRSGASPKHRMIHLSAGLGLVQGIVVDQHFEQRGRWGRLLAAVALSPRLLGIGLDEDTAAVIHADRTLEVLGRGSVTIVDGSQVTTDAHQMHGHRPMMVSGAIVHALPSGYRFDLRARHLLPSEDATGLEASE